MACGRGVSGNVFVMQSPPPPPVPPCSLSPLPPPACAAPARPGGALPVLSLLAALALSSAGGAAAVADDGDALMPPPPPQVGAEESLERLRVVEGFDVELVVAEPLVMDPIAIDWGPDGRLWVVEMADYPLGLDDDEEPGGRVRVLEDTNGDGRFDHSTVFLDGLAYPTGVKVWRGGVLVSCAPEVFFAADTTGDGRADHRETVLTGFVEGNPQLRVNGMRWGLDNWLYGANGWSHGEVAAVNDGEPGEAVDLQRLDFRFRMDGKRRIEPLPGPSQFGLERSDEGTWFGNDNSNLLFQNVLPQRALGRNPHVAFGAPRETLDGERNPPVYPYRPTLRRIHADFMANRFTSICSTTILRDPLLRGGLERGLDIDADGSGAADQWLHAFGCEPEHNLVTRRVLRRGADDLVYQANRAPGEENREFFGSDDPWFRPVMVRTGPDGALWVVDMYRYVIEHPRWVPEAIRERWIRETDLRAGHERGRIYRIVPTGVQPRDWPRLDKLEPVELVAVLGHANGLVRDLAHQLLLWSGDDAGEGALEALAAVVRGDDGAVAHGHLARLHALGVLAGLERLSTPVLMEALRDDEPAVRRLALEFAEPLAPDDEALLEQVLAAAGDPHAVVRLQLAVALGSWPGVDAAGTWLRLAGGDHADRHWQAALAGAAAVHLEPLTAAIAAAHEAGEAPALPLPVWQLLLDTASGGEQWGKVAALAAAVEAGLRDDLIAGLLERLRGRRLDLVTLAEEHDVLQALADEAQDLAQRARQLARADDTAADARRTALGRLGWIGGTAAADLEAAEAVLDASPDPGTMGAAIEVLGRVGDEGAHQRMVAVLGRLLPDQASRTVDLLLNSTAGSLALLQAITAGDVPAALVDSTRRQRLQRHQNEDIKTAAATAFGRGDSDRSAVVAEHRDALELEGDRAAGKVVFANLCAVCHEMDGVGRNLGPDLRSVTDRTPAGLLEAILDPDAIVEPRYMGYIASLASGEVIYGLVTDRTGDAITMVAMDGIERVLPMAEVESLEATGRSWMPEGLEAAMTRQQIADLILYLGYED